MGRTLEKGSKLHVFFKSWLYETSSPYYLMFVMLNHFRLR